MFCSISGRLLGSDPLMGSGKWMDFVLAGTYAGLSLFFSVIDGRNHLRNCLRPLMERIGTESEEGDVRGSLSKTSVSFPGGQEAPPFASLLSVSGPSVILVGSGLPLEPFPRLREWLLSQSVSQLVSQSVSQSDGFEIASGL